MHQIKSIEWTGRTARIIDQTLLPLQKKFINIRDEKQMYEAIKMLRIRGAPAIGVAAAYGLYIGVARTKPKTTKDVKRQGKKVARYLAKSRPTAVNLFWALDRCEQLVESFDNQQAADVSLARLLEEAHAIRVEDEKTCAAMGRHGSVLLRGMSGVLTHCNTGAMATAGAGTALSVIFEATRKNKKLMVYVDETRPLLQGARLTAWELQESGVDYRLISDNMAGTVLQKGMAQAVITGADRIASNGDSANKVGTMPLAIVAKYYGVPFYIAAPLSTFDMELKSGDEIPIEERGSEEIVNFGKRAVAPRGTKTFSPAFDVTPAKLIAGIVTEKGVVRPPFRKNIKALFASK